MDILFVKVQIINDSWTWFPTRTNCFKRGFGISRRAARLTSKESRWRFPRETRKTFPQFLTTKFRQLYVTVIYSLLYFRLLKSGHDFNIKVTIRWERNKWCHTCVVEFVNDALVVIKSKADCELGNTCLSYSQIYRPLAWGNNLQHDERHGLASEVSTLCEVRLPLYYFHCIARTNYRWSGRNDLTTSYLRLTLCILLNSTYSVYSKNKLLFLLFRHLQVPIHLSVPSISA